jgi:hypothetical protein
MFYRRDKPEEEILAILAALADPVERKDSSGVLAAATSNFRDCLRMRRFHTVQAMLESVPLLEVELSKPYFPASNGYLMFG